MIVLPGEVPADSAGLRNDTLRGVLHDMLGKPFASANIVYVPTASVAEPGDHGWFVADLNRLHGLGWREFDIVELNGLPRPMVLDRLLHADVIYVAGGSHYHLARSITGSGLADGFLKALADGVYVGVSAGSMIFSRHLDERSADVMGEAADLHVLGATTARRWTSYPRAGGGFTRRSQGRNPCVVAGYGLQRSSWAPVRGDSRTTAGGSCLLKEADAL